MNGTPPPDVQLENVYDVWIAMRSKLRGYSTVIFDRLQRVVFVGGGGEEKKKKKTQLLLGYDRWYSFAGAGSAFKKPYRSQSTCREDL